MKENHPNRNLRSGKALPPRTRKGFTLVELLVVIAIIAVLAVLSFLGASKMRSKARGATCASNLRQIGIAMISYAQDRNGQLPALEAKNPNGGGNGIWAVLMAREGYLWDTNIPGPPKLGEGVWACPDCDFRNNNQRGYGVVEGTVFQYSDRMSTLNTRLGRSEKGSVRLNAIDDPARTWLVGDAAEKPSQINKSWFAIWPQPTRWANDHTPAARHGGKANVCMADGHVRAMTMEELKAGNYTMYK